MIGQENISEIINSLPLHQEDRAQRRIDMLKPYFDCISLEGTFYAFKRGISIKPVYPEQKWGAAHEDKPQYKKNSGCFWLAAHALYWWCNVKNSFRPPSRSSFF